MIIGLTPEEAHWMAINGLVTVAVVVAVAIIIGLIRRNLK